MKIKKLGIRVCNPFKYTDGFKGFLFTFLLKFISVFSDIIAVVTLTIIQPDWEFDISMWYMRNVWKMGKDKK